MIKMEVSKRKIGIYSIAGVLAAVLIVVSLVASGVQLPTINPSGQQGNNPPGLGTLVVSVKDKPVELSKLDLTITSVWIQVSSNDEDSEENNNGWTNLNLIGDEPIDFDLLELREKSIDLSSMELPAGEYGKIRIYVSKATATYADNTEEELKVPSGRIDIITKVTIENDMQTNLLIDMEPDATAISASGNFRPIIKATLTITEPEDIQPPTETQSQESVPPSPSASPSPTTSP
ncbi:MAG TPA: DUF4382 domain-containing protein [Candidatus Deferrimicrobiaceae bacterium]|nr:DUF4382 domain-containing protein [Candidatus Deferrimicrobiaceae bacterium]